MVVVHSFNPSSWEAKGHRSLCVQAILAYIVSSGQQQTDQTKPSEAAGRAALLLYHQSES